MPPFTAINVADIKFKYRKVTYIRKYKYDDLIIDLVQANHNEFGIHPHNQKYTVQGKLYKFPFDPYAELRLFAGKHITLVGRTNAEMAAAAAEEQRRQAAGIQGPTESDDGPFDWDEYRIIVAERLGEVVGEVDPDTNLGPLLPVDWTDGVPALEPVVALTAEEIQMGVSLDSLPDPYRNSFLRVGIETFLGRGRVPFFWCTHTEDHDYDEELEPCDCMRKFIFEWHVFLSKTLWKMECIMKACERNLHVGIKPTAKKLWQACLLKRRLLQSEWRSGIGGRNGGYLYSELQQIIECLGIDLSDSDGLPDAIYDEIRSMCLAMEMLDRDMFMIEPRAQGPDFPGP